MRVTVRFTEDEYRMMVRETKCRRLPGVSSCIRLLAFEALSGTVSEYNIQELVDSWARKTSCYRSKKLRSQVETLLRSFTPDEIHKAMNTALYSEPFSKNKWPADKFFRSHIIKQLLTVPNIIQEEKINNPSWMDLDQPQRDKLYMSDPGLSSKFDKLKPAAKQQMLASL